MSSVLQGIQPLNWDTASKEKTKITAGICVRFPFFWERTPTPICSPTEALAKVCLFVDEDFGRDHVSERHEHLEYVLVSELLGQVVDEQVGTFGTWRDEMQSEHEVKAGFH